ncbi:MAG: hypothetical protein CMP67_01715 [Flavobacteriales bacterium]|nr:hypothetical protein [Flavobacteriales bacterium]MBO72810.1 hypothetical protein [Flavobacteriales bacterium]|tara:strand:- start:5887 stop:6342 length:456 start_codon:yes stop_codon:yes gene_type:complete
MEYYFAYGSLMDLHFMKSLGVRYENPQSGKLFGYDFQVNVMDSFNRNYGYANVTLNNETHVEGILVEIPKIDLALLDAYEGYPELYSRRKLNIQCSGENKKLESWVYLGNLNCISKRNLKLSIIQKERIKEGFEFLSEGYQKKLLNLMSEE